MARTVNRELISVIATISLAVMAMSEIQPMLSLYLSSLGISASIIGLMFSLAMAGMVFGETGFGWLADKIGLRIPLGIGTILCAPVVLCFAFFTSIPFIFTIFLVWGVVRAAVYGPGRGYIGGNVPAAQKATFLAVYAASMTVSRSIGNFIGGFVAEHYGFDMNFYVAAGIALLGGLIVIFGLSRIPLINPSVPPLAPLNPGEMDTKKPYRSRLFIAQCFVAAFGWAAMGLGNFVPLLVVQRTGAKETEIGLLFTISALVGAALLMPMGRLSDRKNKKTMMVTGLIITSLSYAGLALAGNYGIFIAVMVVQSLGNAIFSPAAVALLSDTVPRHWQNTAMGIYGGCEDLGVVIGSALSGFLWDQVGSEAAFLMIGVVPSLLSALAVLTLLKPRPASAA